MALTKIPANMLSGVDLGDSVRINLGTDNDLALFHTGGNGVIHNTTGELRIRANNLKLQDYTNEDLMIVATSDGSVDLYHNNQKKFETSATGASVTGNLAVSGNLTVSGTTTELDTTNLNVTDKNITLNYHASNDTSSNADGAGITIQDAVNSSTDATLNWSAANDRFVMSHGLQVTSGNVGIGIATPTAMLDVRRGDASGKIAEFHNNSGYGIDIGSSQAVAYISSGYNQRLDFKTDPTSGQTERMSILANGNVGIGQTAPGRKLHIKDAGQIKLENTTTNGWAGLDIHTSVGTNNYDMYMGMLDGNGRFFIDVDSNGEDLSILQNGNVGINDNSPDRKVSIIGDSTSNGQYPLSLDATNTDYTMEFRRNGQSEWWIKQSSGSFRLHENGVADHFTLKAGGNVGIGLTSPSYKLDVGHVSSGEIQARFKSSGDTGYTQGAIVLESSDSASSPETRGQGVFMFNHGTDKTWYAGTLYSNPGSYGIGVVGGSTLQTSAADDGSSLAFVIDQSRKVGIGTQAPNLKLHVEEDADTWVGEFKNVRSAGGYGLRIDNSGAGGATDTRYALGVYTPGNTGFFVRNNGNVGIGTTAPTKSLSVKAPSGSNGGIDVFHNNGNKVAEIVHHGSGDEGRLSLYDGGTGTVQLHGETGQPSYINSGNVGIGDTNPQHPLKVHLTNGEIAMFGSNDMNSPGRYAGIGLGQVLANSTAHQKVSLVTEGRNDGNYRQNFHILVDAAADNGYAVLADKKFTIDGVYGTISMPLQPSFMCYPAATYSQAAGSQKVYWTGESHDVNNWYNNANHRFTAPVAGNYLFMGELALQATTLGQTYLGIGIRINGSGNIYYGGWAAKTGASNQYEKATSTIIKQLAASDYVEIYVELSSTTSVLGGAGGSLSRFSGQLLS